jgi:hypothetical protein
LFFFTRIFTVFGDTSVFGEHSPKTLAKRTKIEVNLDLLTQQRVKIGGVSPELVQLKCFEIFFDNATIDILLQNQFFTI